MLYVHLFKIETLCAELGNNKEDLKNIALATLFMAACGALQQNFFKNIFFFSTPLSFSRICTNCQGCAYNLHSHQ